MIRAGNIKAKINLASLIPLIKKIALTKKPMIISTGMANLNEIDRTFKIAKKYGNN